MRAVARMSKRQLTAGFNTWRENAADMLRQMMAMQKACQRMLHAKLAAAFG